MIRTEIKVNQLHLVSEHSTKLSLSKQRIEHQIILLMQRAASH